MRQSAFTLIELLVVIAIISILAAIALPNFLEAQTRAKVSRVKADMRILATGIEAYRVDHNRYPPCCGVGIYFTFGYSNPNHQRLIPITSPVAYLTSIPTDPFPTHATAVGGAEPNLADYTTYDYVDAHNIRGWGSGISSGGDWRVASPGPDRRQAFGGMPASLPWDSWSGVDYDATNGTLSTGDIVRVGP